MNNDFNNQQEEPIFNLEDANMEDLWNLTTFHQTISTIQHNTIPQEQDNIVEPSTKTAHTNTIIQSDTLNANDDIEFASGLELSNFDIDQPTTTTTTTNSIPPTLAIHTLLPVHTTTFPTQHIIQFVCPANHHSKKCRLILNKEKKPACPILGCTFTGECTSNASCMKKINQVGKCHNGCFFNAHVVKKGGSKNCLMVGCEGKLMTQCINCENWFTTDKKAKHNCLRKH